MAQNVGIREEQDENLRHSLPAGTVVQPAVSLSDFGVLDQADMDDAEWELFLQALRDVRCDLPAKPAPPLD